MRYCPHCGKEIAVPPKVPTTVRDMFVAHFCAEFERKFGTKYPFVGGRDGAAVAAILRDLPCQKAMSYATRFINSDDPFILKVGCSISVMRSVLPKLISGGRVPIKSPPKGRVWARGHGDDDEGCGGPF